MVQRCEVGFSCPGRGPSGPRFPTPTPTSALSVVAAPGTVSGSAASVIRVGFCPVFYDVVRTGVLTLQLLWGADLIPLCFQTLQVQVCLLDRPRRLSSPWGAGGGRGCAGGRASSCCCPGSRFGALVSDEEPAVPRIALPQEVTRQTFILF